jgi:AraC-like DNA-binding protein
MAAKLFKIPSLFEVRFVDSVGGCGRPHTHPSLIITVVSGGHIQLQVGDSEICIESGTVAAVGPHVLHCVREFSSNFSGAYTLEIFGLPEQINEFDVNTLLVFGFQFLYDQRFYKETVILCDQLLGTYEVNIKTEWYEAWLTLLLIKCSANKHHHFSKNPEIVRSATLIKQILDGEIGEEPPYAQIALTLNYSKEHCNRIFKQVYQITVQAYFLNRKAAKARELLDSGVSLSEVALRCGFYDQSHFIRIFKGLYQISPQNYRLALNSDCHSHTRK